LGVAFATGLAEAGADIAIPDDCTHVVEETVKQFGRVDVMINNAGIGSAVPATREAPDDFRRVIDVNLNGSYFMAQACARAMRDSGGSIVNVAHHRRSAAGRWRIPDVIDDALTSATRWTERRAGERR
jgi:NAD(P)-dependent dehydrogenase (short-subunit alcohol dehydrogenase family)